MDLPPCKNPACPRSDMKLLSETDQHFTVVCRTCSMVHARSRTRTKLIAREAVATKKRLEAETMEKAKMGRKIFV